MTIRRPRLAFESHYTQLPNAWLRDPRLSYRARGVLAMMMSHAEGWQIGLEGIVAGGLEGRDAIRSTIKELEGLGYLTRLPVREGGRFSGTDYVISDPEEQATPPAPEKPTSVKPTAEKPAPGNRPLRRTSSLEEQVVEEHSVTPNGVTAGDAVQPVLDSMPATPAEQIKADSREVAKRLVELHPGLKFPVMMKMAERAMKAYGVDLATVGRTMDGLYAGGRALTDQTVGQALEGIITADGRRPLRSSTDDRVLQTLSMLDQPAAPAEDPYQLRITQ